LSEFSKDKYGVESIVKFYVKPITNKEGVKNE